MGQCSCTSARLYLNIGLDLDDQAVQVVRTRLLNRQSDHHLQYNRFLTMTPTADILGIRCALPVARS